MSADHRAAVGPAAVDRDLLFDLTVPARADRLQMIRGTVEWAAHTAGFAPSERDGVVLAVDEACQNVIRHGYGGDSQAPLRVRAGLSEGALVVRVIDAAPAVDPRRIRPRALDDLRPGGLGTRLISQMLDEAVYEDPPQGTGNVLRLVKRLEGKAT